MEVLQILTLLRGKAFNEGMPRQPTALRTSSVGREQSSLLDAGVENARYGVMRDPYAVLSEMEIDISRLRREIAALRLVIELMDKDDDNSSGSNRSMFDSARPVRLDEDMDRLG